MAAFESGRATGVPARAMMNSIDEQDAAMKSADAKIRAFIEEKGILSNPTWLGPASLKPIPSTLAPLWGLFSDNDMATTDALIGGGRGEMGFGLTRFTVPPSPELGFFPRSATFDVRPVRETLP